MIAGLALATALWSGVQAINAEARASYDAAAATLGEGQFDQLLPRSGEKIDQATYIALRRAGWQVSPVLEGHVRTEEGRVRVVGVDPLTAPGTIAPVGMQEDSNLDDFLTRGVLFAAPDVAEALSGVVSQRVITDPSVAPGVALTDIGVAQTLLDAHNQLSRLIIAPMQPMGLPDIAAVAPDLALQPAQDAGADRLTDSFHLNLTAFGLLSFAVGIFIVHGTISLAFEQRRSMVRTLRALGVPLTTLIGLMISELVVFAVLAGGIGVALGYVIAAVLLPNVAATLQGLYGASVAGTLQLRPEWWLSGMAIAVLGTGFAASGALWNIAQMPLLASARPRAWAVASGETARRLGAVALALLVIGTGIAIWGQGLTLAFALLACLLIGAALILPLLLRSAVMLADGQARSAMWQWFWADTRQQVPGMSLALMALLLATAANVGVSTMVSSFRVTFVDFLDQRLAPELFIRIEDPAQSPYLEAILLSEAQEVLPLLSVETEIAAVPTDLFGVRVGPTYRENWLFLDEAEDVWDRVETGNAVVVSEQLARRAGIWTDDLVTVAPGLSLPIAAIVADYGNPLGQALISEPLFRNLYPEMQPLSFGVRSNDPTTLRNVLTEEHGIPESAITDQSRIKAFSLGVFERTFTVTGALNVLTLAVAAFAILMSLLTLASIRVPQLAPAWALGLTRRRLGQLELLRAVVLAMVTTVLAIPLGLMLAWVLLSYVNVEAFGWKLPLYLFPGHYAVLTLFALLAAALAALWPAIRLARTPPSDLLKVFANDR
ncbi:ABC transporter permease [Marivita cryptomonadis]|uniref:ABC transporter permease n=2 Tax=Marivita cryptomonadis TaxID=505252 RepID=A0A9Q2S088_9RHOB|nr:MULTISPECIES: ABC transporter permease [Marivita]MCR9167697.1 ABC transporter permease [Paracoccaceae bacterium]MBM2322102.1 ABC transporter permease [Marivita cryptomonadis]MBM2331683.1 ABC transporter permease [Marivita cryptomonadis]MBM2341268.1 ABC transporter permease [Marivita cryptomonadis]MBM2345931.1 ABC transporter permease [Marivita cryptomonadis]